MDNQKSEKNSEIWLKYCEECVKSKIEIDIEIPSDILQNSPKKETTN